MRRLKLVILLAGLALSLRGERVEWTSSRLQGSPEPPPPFRLVPAFPGIAFKEPIFLAQEPGAGCFWVSGPALVWAVMAQRGTAWFVEPSPADER